MMKRGDTVFYINFSSAPHFSCLGIDFEMGTPVAASLFCWLTQILFPLGFIVHLSSDLIEMLGDPADSSSYKLKW